MKKSLLLSLAVLAVLFNLSAQCTETSKTKVLLIGDSWASFMNIDQTINNAMKNWGHSGVKYISNTTVAENGAETNDFLTASKLNAIKTLFAQNPDIEVVHVSIGGNDFLGDWKKSFSAGKTDTLFFDVKQRLLAIFDSLKSYKPGVQIVWSGYCYPNFKEVINTSSLGSNHPFYSTWQKMEFPDFIEINNLLNRVSDSVASYAANDPQLHFVPATGILQYTYGQTTALGVAPGGTYPAYTVPLPYGDPNYPSNKNSMRDYFLTKDCFHLSPAAYLDFIEYQVQKFYHKFFMNDFYVLSENTNTGSVSSQGNVSSTLSVGESAGETFASVLSFNTSAMYDTTLAKASVFIRRESLTGTNPITGNLQLKIKSGSFSGNATVEAADYNAAGDANGSACLFGVSNTDKKWFRLDLPSSFLPFITKNNPVQISVAPAAGFTGGKVTLSNASNPEFAPVLNMVYGQTPVGLTDEKGNEIQLLLFPNPANNVLNVQVTNATITGIEITDVVGRILPATLSSNGSINIQHLSAGNYFLKVMTTAGQTVKQFVKE